MWDSETSQDKEGWNRWQFHPVDDERDMGKPGWPEIWQWERIVFEKEVGFVAVVAAKC